MCSKGHSTCDKCTKKYITCVKCHYPFLTTRNLALESISFEIGIQCKVCKKKFTSGIFYEHNCLNNYECKQNDENENVYNCRITQIDNNYQRSTCRWTGFVKDINEHFLMNHLSNRFNLDCSQVFKWTLPFAQDQENISLIVYKDNIYLQEVFYDVKNKVLYFSVFEINQNNYDFYFRILIPKKNQKYFEAPILKNYNENIQKLKNRQDVLEIDIESFDMRKDREITWILSIHKE